MLRNTICAQQDQFHVASAAEREVALDLRSTSRGCRRSSARSRRSNRNSAAVVADEVDTVQSAFPRARLKRGRVACRRASGLSVGRKKQQGVSTFGTSYLVEEINGEERH